VIAVQKKIRDLREDVAELRKQKDAEKLIDKLEKLAEEVPGSFAETQAKELISQLQALKAQLR
jgi:predicted ATP-grasp superfamily ATP-dependent carboligase